MLCARKAGQAFLRVAWREAKSFPQQRAGGLAGGFKPPAGASNTPAAGGGGVNSASITDATSVHSNKKH